MSFFDFRLEEFTKKRKTFSTTSIFLYQYLPNFQTEMQFTKRVYYIFITNYFIYLINDYNHEILYSNQLKLNSTNKNI